jgi:hypothetical protein
MDRQRTIKQNASLHKYAELLAETLDAGGYDMRTLIRVPIRPNKDNVKEEMIKPIMKALYPEKESTTQLTTKEMQEVYEVCNRATAQKLGISIEWPSNQPWMLDEA